MYNPPENRLKRASIEHTICTFWKHNKKSGMSKSTDRGKHVRPEISRKIVHLNVQRLADLDPCSDAIFSTSKRSGRSVVDTASKVVRSQLPVIFTGLAPPFEHWFSLLQLASTMSPLRNMINCWCRRAQLLHPTHLPVPQTSTLRNRWRFESMMTGKTHGAKWGNLCVTCATLPNFWWEKCHVQIYKKYSMWSCNDYIF